VIRKALAAAWCHLRMRWAGWRWDPDRGVWLKHATYDEVPFKKFAANTMTLNGAAWNGFAPRTAMFDYPEAAVLWDPYEMRHYTLVTYRVRYVGPTDLVMVDPATGETQAIEVFPSSDFNEATSD
jgi:hypothetical protein